jgi:hypothetical protein
MIVCTRGTSSLSLYMERRLRCNSSPSRIQLRSSRSIIGLTFIIFQLVKALVWFWLIDETSVLTSMLSV